LVGTEGRWEVSVSARAIRYVEKWIFNNVRNEKIARTTADWCWAAAVETGISAEEIQEDFGEIGDLETLILREIGVPGQAGVSPTLASSPLEHFGSPQPPASSEAKHRAMEVRNESQRGNAQGCSLGRS